MTPHLFFLSSALQTSVDLRPSMAPLIDDVTVEILLRHPPDEPEHLFRAALVCEPWLRTLCDPGFRRRYRAFHGALPSSASSTG
ncbi:hypothetical protein ZWY2020_015847 [Hordeum vulgare]|nr:hypothetical protein ZWY2020_015847 [Hordeum vulgare]